MNSLKVDDADEDASGSVNFQEFVTLMMKRQEGGQTREEIKQVCSTVYACTLVL